MKISYDYEDLIRELEEEIEDGTLTVTDTILILRSQESIPHVTYFPIVDWFYNADDMAKMCKVEPFDEDDDIAEKVAVWNQYVKEASELKPISVHEALKEIRYWNRIL